jgi:DNA-binding MarR family transcriptional regulator
MKSEISKNLISLAPRLMDVSKTHIRKASAGRLTPLQYRIMANVFRGLQTVTEIAAHHGVAQPTITKTINLMVHKKWIEKIPDEKDGRQFRLNMTEKGLDLFSDVRKVAQKSLDVQIKLLSKTEVKILEKAVDDLQNILRTWNSINGNSK